MRARPGGPYDYPPGYRWRWVYQGWDGVDRTILAGGVVVPPFPKETQR